MKPQARRSEAGSGAGRERIYIEYDSVRRPFMRGILVHSLMAHGLAFDDAYCERQRGARAAARSSLGHGGGAVAHRAGGAARARAARGGRRPADRAVDPHPRADAARRPSRRGSCRSRCSPPRSSRTTPSTSRARSRASCCCAACATSTGASCAGSRSRRSSGASDERTAERYLVWRRFQDPDRPVILLLGGATGVGQDVARARGRPPARHPPRDLHRLDPPDHAPDALRGAGAGDPRLLVRRAPGDRPSRDDAVIDGFLAQAVDRVGRRARDARPRRRRERQPDPRRRLDRARACSISPATPTPRT